jgi:hypothetical protein
MKKGRRIDAQCQAAGSQGHISGRLIDGFVLLLAVFCPRSFSELPSQQFR